MCFDQLYEGNSRNRAKREEKRVSEKKNTAKIVYIGLGRKVQSYSDNQYFTLSI